MTLSTSIVIAMKSKYSGYNMREINIFQMKKANVLFNNNLELNFRNKRVDIKFKCPICDKYHNFSYNICDVFKKEILIGGCESLGLPVVLLGKPDKVRCRIEKYVEINRKIYMMI